MEMIYVTIERIELPKGINGELYFGDNLEVVRSIKTASIDLGYLDPPFFSGRDYTMKSKVDKDEVRQFEDTFKTINDYLKFLYPRLVQIRRVLKPTGTIYIHADWHAIFEIKCYIMDRIFGRNNFINHIVWCYSGGGCGTRKFAAKHDDILSYSITDKYTFNADEVREPFAESSSGQTVHRKGKEYQYELNELGRIPNDWWIDIPSFRGNASELVDYPTQKPEPLLERIIKASSNKGDVVMDLFGGSGTTAAVCKRLGRRFITCDKSEDAINVIKARLLGNKSIYDKGYQPDIENAWKLNDA